MPASEPIPLDLLQDLGGEGPLLHLAHANGFPPGTYRPLAENLKDRFHVISLPLRPLWPGRTPAGASSWHVLADDLARGLEELGFSSVIGVGHSLGGVCTMLAAVGRPKLFRALVLIDPVILPPLILLILKLLRRLGLAERQPLVKGARQRRRVWPSREACYNSYRGKPVFARWPDASLRAYVKAGTRRREDGQVELAYPPEWEAHIYATNPTDIWRYVPKVQAPLLVIYGEDSDTFRPASQRRMARLLPAARFSVIPGAGHLVAMEHPDETGAIIKGFLNGLWTHP
jgi:pimeloyl-ACP methyl ester carboxylesterase